MRELNGVDCMIFELKLILFSVVVCFSGVEYIRK